MVSLYEMAVKQPVDLLIWSSTFSSSFYARDLEYAWRACACPLAWGLTPFLDNPSANHRLYTSVTPGLGYGRLGPVPG